MDTAHKLNVHKTFEGRPGHRLNNLEIIYLRTQHFSKN